MDDRTVMIIGFGGPMTAGKDYSAEYVAQHVNKPVIHRFADPVKQIAKEQFGWDGVKDERGRTLLQLIGTDVGRAYYPNIWVDRLASTYRNYVEADQTLLVPDTRFPNEVEWIRSQGGIAILIESAHTETNGIANHPSETEMYKADWTARLTNNKDEQFKESLKSLLITLGIDWIE